MIVYIDDNPRYNSIDHHYKKLKPKVASPLALPYPLSTLSKSEFLVFSFNFLFSKNWREALWQNSPGAPSKKKSRITITGPTSIIRSRVIPGTSKLLKTYNELIFTYHLNDFDDWLDELRKGTAQFAVIPRTMVPKEMESKLLKPEFFVLVGPKKWARRPLQEIVEQERIIDFDQNDPMTMNYLKKHHLQNKIKRERHYVNNTESLMELIEAGHGYGVLALEFVEQFSHKIILLNQEKLYEHHMALCWYHRPEMPKYFQEIIRSIR